MSLKPAATTESLLDELQTTLAHGTVARRVETLLWRLFYGIAA